MRKYVGDLNTRDELQRKLTKELGKQSIFLYQRLNHLEEKAEIEYLAKQLTKKISNVIVLHDKSAEADTRTKNKQLI